MEKQKRRSRMKRQPTGRSLVLTPRDLAIFELLERYRYLRSTHIHAFVGGASETRFKERLGDLYHEGGYLSRPEKQWEAAHSRYLPVVYESTNAARRVLAESGRACSAREVSGSPKQFAHTLLTCEVLASLELAATANPKLRFISSGEILARAPEATRNSPLPFRIPWRTRGDTGFIVPDALFGLEYVVDGQKSYRFFALEVDRTTMPVMRSKVGQTSFCTKLMAYETALASGAHKSHLGVPNLLVLTVTTSERHKENIMSAVSADGYGAAFLFKFIQGGCCGGISRAEPSILSDAWERAGRPPLNITVG